MTTINEKLLKTRFVIDSGKAHITLKNEACLTCREKPCINVCPAQCYELENERVSFSWENCVECGSCRIVCPAGAITWDYPRGGFGVCYRFG